MLHMTLQEQQEHNTHNEYHNHAHTQVFVIQSFVFIIEIYMA